MRLIHKLRCQFDEPYRIRMGFGLSPIRNNRELKALIRFCEHELQEEHMKLNPALEDVLGETVRLYRANSSELHDYINRHVEWYWS